ncbi:hypothetical protein GGS20DRAFT_523091 [Poronia punctata]|nr:hypothetical protein GGS20DRAFT_523091 [Poronia punctata]
MSRILCLRHLGPASRFIRPCRLFHASVNQLEQSRHPLPTQLSRPNRIDTSESPIPKLGKHDARPSGKHVPSEIQNVKVTQLGATRKGVHGPSWGEAISVRNMTQERHFLESIREEIQGTGLGEKHTPSYVRKLVKGLARARNRNRGWLAQTRLMEVFQLPTAQATRAKYQLKHLLPSGTDETDVVARLEDYVTWKTCFSNLIQKVTGTSTSKQSNQARENVGCEGNDLKSVHFAWQRLDPDKREPLWQHMIASAILSNRRMLPDLINVTFEMAKFDPSACRGYVFADILHVVCDQYKLAVENDPARAEAEKEQLQVISSSILERAPSRYMRLNQDILYQLSCAWSVSELPRLVEMLERLEVPVDPHTWLQFASRLAKSHTTKDIGKGIILRLAEMPGFDINSPAAASVCTLLLCRPEGAPPPTESVQPSVLYKLLHERGWRPNLIHLTCMMQDACDLGQPTAAFDVLDVILQLGMKPDLRVFSVITNALKQIPDDAHAARVVAAIASSVGWSERSYALFLRLLRRMLRPSQTWNGLAPDPNSQSGGKRQYRELMFYFYVKLFDIAPLQRFTNRDLSRISETELKVEEIPELAPFHDVLQKHRLRPERPLAQPDPITMFLMLEAFLYPASGPMGFIIGHYNAFKYLVRQEDPTAMSLLTNIGTRVYDMYLLHLMKSQTTVSFAISELVKMMEAAEKERAESGRNVYHHRPSVYTWNTIIQGLLNHRDSKGALYVFHVMVNIGKVQPNVRTWNCLTHAFAREGHVEGVVASILSLQAAGFETTDQTFGAIMALPTSLRAKAMTHLQKLRSKLPALNTRHGDLGLAVSKYLGKVFKRLGKEHGIRIVRTDSINKAHSLARLLRYALAPVMIRTAPPRPLFRRVRKEAFTPSADREETPKPPQPMDKETTDGKNGSQQERQSARTQPQRRQSRRRQLRRRQLRRRQSESRQSESTCQQTFRKFTIKERAVIERAV